MRDNVVGRQSGSSVSFGNVGDELWRAVSDEKLCSEYSVSDVWLVAVAFDVGSIAEEYANVVEHSSGFDVGFGDRELLGASYGDSFVGNATAVA